MAAVELLIGHASWLCRPDFLGGFVEFVDGLGGPASMAFVDWRAAVAALDAGTLGCSAGEGRVLRVAASLADGIPVDLRRAVTGLDATGIALVARAVLAANGRRDARVGVDDPGLPPGHGLPGSGGSGSVRGRTVR